MSRWCSLVSTAVNRADRLTKEGIAFTLLAVYILKSKGQEEGVEVMVQWREMRKTRVSQRIDHEPRASETVWPVAILLAHAGQIWGKPFCLQVESTYTLDMYDGMLT